MKTNWGTRPIPSRNGRLFEVIGTDADCWIACVFHKAPGHMVDPTNPQEWNETLFHKQGELMANLHTYTKPYVGKIGTDIHHQNFHVADGNIVLFDFDDCAYSWYAYDIASTLFFIAGTADYRKAGSGKEILGHFGKAFLRGYRQNAELPSHWLSMLPLFLRYRRLAQYKYFTNLFHGQTNPYEAYLAWVKDDILSGFQYLEYDFSH